MYFILPIVSIAVASDAPVQFVYADSLYILFDYVFSFYQIKLEISMFSVSTHLVVFENTNGRIS